jgi:hypothetical protein
MFEVLCLLCTMSSPGYAANTTPHVVSLQLAFS